VTKLRVLRYRQFGPHPFIVSGGAVHTAELSIEYPSRDARSQSGTGYLNACARHAPRAPRLAKPPRRR
jgi:hypothetical protein